MQRIANTCGGHHQRSAAVRRSRRSEATATVRDTAASGITTLARRSGQCLPKLDGVPAAYDHELKAELLYDLCTALIQCGIGKPEHWKESGANGSLFVRHALRDAITQDRLDLLQRNIEYHLNIVDVVDRFGDERALEVNELAVLITSGNCGYLEIGVALEALEQEEKGLGSAFYWELIHSLYRAIRIYDHSDAFQYEERQREYAESDEENADQYEFAEVEKGLPECIRASLKRDRNKGRFADRRLLLKYRKGRFGSWIERLRNIQRHARLYRNKGKDLSESGYYDSPPVPSLLIVFKQHDVIAACFDEESQYMLESVPEPALSIVFCPNDPEEVARTREAVRHFIAINCELFQLVEEIQQWESQNANRHSDRGELSLRAQ
jgi:hypothetical protein